MAAAVVAVKKWGSRRSAIVGLAHFKITILPAYCAPADVMGFANLDGTTLASRNRRFPFSACAIPSKTG